MICASAGSGKTFQLGNRLIALLLAGVSPERIIGLTFSRKAAGEIFDKLIARLAAGATSVAGAEELARALVEGRFLEAGDPMPGREEWLRLLRSVVSRMHVMRVGTIDSFFVSILRAFPFEFGLSGELEILDGQPAVAARRRALRRVLRAGGQVHREREGFLRDFRLATFGREEKGFAAVLDRFVEDAHGTYLEAGDERLWGRAAGIWPEGAPWALGAADCAGCADALDAALRPVLDERAEEYWARAMEQARSFTDQSVLSDPLARVLENLVSRWEELSAGSAKVPVNGVRHVLCAAACEAAMALVRGVGG